MGWNPFSSVSDTLDSANTATTSAVAAKKQPTAFDALQAKKKEILDSLQGQQKAYDQAPEALRQAAIDTIANTRANTGKSLAAGRGLTGGGRGVALMSQVAQDRGLQEGATNAQYTERIQNALAQAAQARTNILEEQGKNLQLETDRGKDAIAAAAQAETDWQTAMDNTTVFTDSDATKARNALYAKAALEADPTVAQAIRDVADRRYNEEVN
ncbi:hypothetical protein UFOVP777_14 [uncultured Caudovirales phage]|uniref:Uncharacterized protein n=1 Tax=uncultured Caudovirales phage TaxID=2100421 RepID=A0A6J5NQ86_9CAUD|nr:hypothetical protein UFOVP777_14 [uncultured Caudovirales phage]